MAMEPSILTSLLSTPERRKIFDELVGGFRMGELTSLLLEVFRRKTESLTPQDILDAYTSNRFVAPAESDAVAMQAFGLSLMKEAAAHGFTTIGLSPAAPLGASSVVAPCDQNKILSALRGTEAVSDPTNVLALEASVRRRDARRNAGTRMDTIRLSALQRVIRTPPPGDPRFRPHFDLFGMTSAGHDRGTTWIEEEIVHHVSTLVALSHDGIAGAAAHRDIRIAFRIHDRRPAIDRLSTNVMGRIAATLPDIVIEREYIPQHDQPYYKGLRFKLSLRHEGTWYETGDGGIVDWTARYLSDRNERCVISGIGTEFTHRLLMLKKR